MYTLGDISTNGAIHFPDWEAIVFEETRMTYRQLNARVNRLANALTGLGCKKGDHLAVLAENCGQYVEIYFAAAKIGVCVCPQNHRLADEELIYVINDGESTLFMVGHGFEDRACSIQDSLKKIRHWISIEHPIDGYRSYEELVRIAPETEPVPASPVDEQDLAILMYTGGTTGLPKGVMLTHRNLMTTTNNAVLTAATELANLGPGRRFSTCMVLPMFHVSLWPVLLTLSIGGKVVINRKMDLGEILRLIQDEQCAHINLVPTIYGWLVDYPEVDQYDISSLIYMTYAGSPFPTEVLKKCIRRFGNIFSQGYGATETAGGAATVLSFRDHEIEGPRSRLLASAGKAAPCSRIKIADDEGRALPYGQSGEICVTGKHIMSGYWKDPEKTAQALRDGWYHTGDMGYMDEDGYVFLTDRKADMIISGGENVYPKETEDVLYQHKAVAQCAVVSAPDPRWGEIVKAVVVLQQGKTATEEELIAFCKERLAGYKCPKSVVFWAELPTSIIGKVLKKEIKAAFWQGQDRKIG